MSRDGKEQWAACLEGAGAVDSPRPSSQHANPPSLSFICEMAVRRPACKYCCEESGQSWQQKNGKPWCVSGMQIRGLHGHTFVTWLSSVSHSDRYHLALSFIP